MKSLRAVSTSLLILAASTTSVLAQSKSTVHVETNSNSTSHTEIHINTNGVEKNYVSDQPGSVTITSEDGNSVVHVENNTRTPTSQPSPTTTTTPSSTPIPKKEVLSAGVGPSDTSHITWFFIMIRSWLSHFV